MNLRPYNLILFAILSMVPGDVLAVDYPLKAAPSGRYLVDQTGKPFLIIGDAPHNLFTGYTTDEASIYLRNRASNGVNSLWVECLTGPYTSGPADGSNKNGDKPFTNTLTSGCYDLTSPNIPYWQHCSNVMRMVETNGLQLLLDSFETGQYLSTAVTNGPTRCRTYGQFLGNWFKGFSNYIWITGNDFVEFSTETNDICINAIGLGINDVDATHLQTLQLSYYNDGSISYDDVRWRGLLDINGVYSYVMPYNQTLKAYNTNTMPVLYLEGAYENEFYFGAGGTPSNLRRQEYWTLLSGSLAGHMYGQGKIWPPVADWTNWLNTVGIAHLEVFRDFFTNIAWYTLVPDQYHTIVTAGYGTRFVWVSYPPSHWNEDDDYAPAARSSDGNIIVCYLPTIRQITVDMTKLSGVTTARWFDPTDGTYSTVAGSPFANTGTSNFTPNGTNSAGDEDWVLLLQANHTVYVSGTANVGTITKQEVAGGGGGGLPLAYDASNHATDTDNAQSCNITVGQGENRLLVILIGYGNASQATVSSCRFDGTNCSAITGFARHDGAGSGVIGYYLLAPRSGTYPLQVTLSSGPSAIQVGGIVFSNAHQSSTFGTAVVGSNTADRSATVTVTSGTGEIVVGYTMMDCATLVVGGTADMRYEDEDFAGDYAASASTDDAGSASVVMSFTGDAGHTGWSMGAVSVKPAP